VISRVIRDAQMFCQLQGEDLQEAERLFQEAQLWLAELSSNGQFLIAEDSGHLVIIEPPDLVFESITNLVESQ
jgi:pimeloyl-ACP methyl ester carboxylesterase